MNRIAAILALILLSGTAAAIEQELGPDEFGISAPAQITYSLDARPKPERLDFDFRAGDSRAWINDAGDSFRTAKFPAYKSTRQKLDAELQADFDRVFTLFPRLKERQQQTAGSLSGGEQQMLAIGRALMGNPRVLLMDEPSEGLAPLIVAEVRRTIARLKEEGQSIVLVEQNIKLAFDLADEVVILNTGRVAFSGGVEQVKNDEALITQHLGVF